MKNTIRQIFHSSKFVVGFIIFVGILLFILIYPLFNPGNPLEMIGVGTFAKPGTYFSLYDSVTAETQILNLPDAEKKRLANVLNEEDRTKMAGYLEAVGVPADEIDISDTQGLLELWEKNYDETARPAGMTKATRNYYKRLNQSLSTLGSGSERTVMEKDGDGTESQIASISPGDYVNVKDVANSRTLVLGTDNFGRDVLKELASAAGTSVVIGLIAGTVATLIGLLLGLLSGYMGGWIDDIIMFFTNIFTVIPSFVLLILISYSIGQDQRGASVVALVIGLTSWTWTTRSVRSQVISLRNRDHVNLSRLSGHSLPRILVTDILPYIASYVVMAFILQVSSGILAEAQLSLLGLGPKTTEVPTLGLMMNWAMLYSAHLNGSWWAYFPVILMITLISFSLNLMNTGLDQVFNPTLRD